MMCKHPEALEVLPESGMQCLGCLASQAESLESICSVYGLETEKLIGALNKRIAKSKA